MSTEAGPLVPYPYLSKGSAMTKVRRLLVVTAGLAVAALVGSTQLHGGSNKNDRTPLLPADGRHQPGGFKMMADPEMALAHSKFAESRVVTYKPLEGDQLFALQVQPDLGAVPRQPRDSLIVIATTANMAGPSWL